MKRIVRQRWLLLTLLAVVLITSVTVIFVIAGSKDKKTATGPEDSNSPATTELKTETTQVTAEVAKEEPVKTVAPQSGQGDVLKSPLPDESSFQAMAESDRLQLKADPQTGHFTVTDKSSGEIWRSYPNPDGWSDEQTTAAWKQHLQSPFMMRYVEFNVRKDLDVESNFIAQQGKVTSFKKTEDGFRIVYELPNLGFVIPVQVRLKDDYVETKILQDGLIDEKIISKTESGQTKDQKARLVAIRLFPFLGAETSDHENGFLLIPDGPGALIDFKKDQPNLINFYNERVYGDDWAYSSSFSNRQPVKMPIFGIKSGKQAVLGIVQEGAEYANIFAVPSKSFSAYNWATTEHQFRFKFFQTTDKKGFNGFFTYNQDLIGGDRATRYYFISGDNPDYVDLAVRYRTYLMEESGMNQLQGNSEKIPLHLNLLGGDIEKGFLWDSYLPLTTTSEAKGIVQELNSLGVEQMSIAYMGWQKGGYSKYGSQFPVDGKLGGNGGMKTFVDYAHSKGFPVYLDGSAYSFNNSGGNGFRKSRDGLRDLSSTVVQFTNEVSALTIVGPKFMEKVIDKDLDKVKPLNVDGYLYGHTIGTFLNSDYNEKIAVMRPEALKVQQNIMQKTKETLGNVRVDAGNMYTARYVDHMYGMFSDYSHDMFVDRIVPFEQIALHGLVSYSHNYANLNGDYKNNYLKGIEYGAEPSFLITHALSNELLKSRSLSNFYSTNYKDWMEEMVSLYQQYNEALNGLHNKFIVGHRKLTEDVFETTYSNGRRIIVNYKDVPYSSDGISVKAKDFIALGGE